MASYSIGDGSDDEDEFDFQRQQQTRGGGAGGGTALGPVSSRQPHQYVDPFDDDFASPSSSRNVASATPSAAGPAARAPRSYDDALIFDDFTGGKPANPLGTASDVRDSHGTSDFNRYDVYEE